MLPQVTQQVLIPDISKTWWYTWHTEHISLLWKSLLQKLYSVSCVPFYISALCVHCVCVPCVSSVCCRRCSWIGIIRETVFLKFLCSIPVALCFKCMLQRRSIWIGRQSFFHYGSRAICVSRAIRRNTLQCSTIYNGMQSDSEQHIAIYTFMHNAKIYQYNKISYLPTPKER